MLGHKWKKTMTENSVDTYEKKFKKYSICQIKYQIVYH